MARLLANLVSVLSWLLTGVSSENHLDALVHHLLQLFVEALIHDAFSTGQLALLPLGEAMNLLDEVLELLVRDLLVIGVHHCGVHALIYLVFFQDLIVHGAFFFDFIAQNAILKVVHGVHRIQIFAIRRGECQKLDITLLSFSHLAQTHL